MSCEPTGNTIATRPVAVADARDGVRASEHYRRAGRRRLLLVAAGGCLAAVFLMIDLGTGAAGLSGREILTAVFFPDRAPEMHRTVVWTFRMTTGLMALAVGAALGVAGAQMQTILNNPLASPYTLGVSAAAGFGAALAMTFGASLAPSAMPVLVPVSAFVCAVLSSLTLYAIARGRPASTESIILGGVALLFLFNAGVALLQYAASEEELAAIVFWMFGSLQGATWGKLAVVAGALVASVAWFAGRCWRLTALRFGDDRARSMGIDVGRLRLETLVVVSVLTATAVCFTGSIGFIGLVAPHLARGLVGEDQRFLMPLSAILGALLLSVASVGSKVILPGVIFPIGIATAIFGVPFFGAMILTKRGTNW